MAQSYTPFIIQIDLIANLEDCPDVIPVIRRKLMRSAFDGKDGPMRLTFVKSETGAAKTILEKFRDIADHPDVTRLRVLATCPNNASSAGVDDTAVSKINEGWRKDRQRRKSENMPNPDRALIEQMQGATGQPVVGRSRRSKPPTEPNKSELHRMAHNLFKHTRKPSPSSPKG